MDWPGTMEGIPGGLRIFLYNRTGLANFIHK